MNILALDACSHTTSVALACANNLYSKDSTSEDVRHSEEIDILIAEVLGRAKIRLSEIDVLIAGAGPGSFTGLRIAFSYMKGVASALRKPLLSQCSFKAAAVSWYASQCSNDRILVTADARRGELYAVAFESLEDTMSEKGVSIFSTDELSSLRKTAKEVSLEDASGSFSLSKGHIAYLSRLHGSFPQFSVDKLSELAPNYVRAVNAKKIKERQASSA